VGELGGAFFHKRGHAFFLVVGGKQCVEQAALKHDAVGQAAFKRFVDRLFGGHDGDAREARNGERGAQGFVHEFVEWHHAAHQAGALGFGGVHHAGGEGQVHGFGFAHGARQALGAARTGDDAELDLGLAKLGVVGGDDEVAHHGQLAAATQRKAADGGDHGFANVANGFPVAGDVVAFVHIGKAVGGHGANVGTGGKGFFATSDDHAADVVLRVKALQGLTQLGHELVVERVELLGAVEGDNAHGAFGADLDAFVCHGLSLGVVLDGVECPRAAWAQALGAGLEAHHAGGGGPLQRQAVDAAIARHQGV
jgi:hypothetical protein